MEHVPASQPFVGYTHPDYAASLAEFGSPRLLPRSGGWLLERGIPGESVRDAMGCYPLFACRDWAGLEDDLSEIEDVVCLSLVTDPLGGYDEERLHRCFTTSVIPFKQHLVCDLRRPVQTLVSKHHRYYALKALGQVKIERSDEPYCHLDEWMGLWRHLKERHDLHGLKALSRRAFATQLGIPGMVMLRATSGGETIAAHLWLKQGEVAHSHLAAANPAGYDLMASYALHWYALQTFDAEVRWLNLGGGAGLSGEDTDGLTTFKRGWATDSRTAYFCTRIFDRNAYCAIAEARGLGNSSYFPAYRDGELA